MELSPELRERFRRNVEADQAREAEANGQAAPGPRFAAPIPSSQLKAGEGARWLWQGMLGRGAVTMLSALWKSGKTTLLVHLLRALEAGGEFCGLDVQAGRILYVTEESESLWAERRDRMGLRDHIEFLVRPFGAKSAWADWREFIGYLTRLCQERGFDLIVLDTISKLWPVRDENDASQVEGALMPLHQLGERVA